MIKEQKTMDMTSMMFELVKRAVREVIDEVKESLQAPKISQTTKEPDIKPMTRKEVSKKFSISLVTIHNMMKSGILPYHRIGCRKLFFYEHEIISAFPKYQNKQYKAE
jgi:hypothetical protein